MKTTNIKGKEYIEVNERLKYFRKNYEGYSLTSEILSVENGVCIIKAEIKNEEGNVLATGHAYEKEDSTFINKTSYIENCETSAWGRALGNLGIGIDTSVASAEEVTNAINNSNQEPKAVTKQPKKTKLTKEKYEELKEKGTKKEILNVLDTYEMSEQARKLLKQALEIAK